MSKFQRVIAARWVKSLWLVALLLALTLGQRAGHAAEMRFALVIGNDEYKSTKLATPANDAGLVANALTAAGFTGRARAISIRQRCVNRFANFSGR